LKKKGGLEKMGNIQIAFRHEPPNFLKTVSESRELSRSLKAVSKKAIERAESEAILEALNHTHWNRREAAHLLEISYKAMLNKIKAYGLENVEL